MKAIPHSPSSFTPEQTLQYLRVVQFKPAIEDAAYDISTFVPSIQNLRVLTHLHLLAFTFENSGMHYTPDHMMDITPQGIFRRFVIERRGGSYCFGMNILLFEVLRSLRYRAYMGGARYEHFYYNLLDMTKCPHCLTFVQSSEEEGSTYVVDVGLAAAGLVRPILLSETPGNEIMGTTPSEIHRVKSINTPKGEDGSLVWWRLEVHRTDESKATQYTPGSPAVGAVAAPTEFKAWNSVLIFSEREFSQAEFEHASQCILKVADSARFWWMVVCMKYFLVDPQGVQALPEDVSPADVDPSDACYGRLTMAGNMVNKSIGTRSEVIQEMKREKDRIEALRDIFKVKVDLKDATHVEGRAASLNSNYSSPATEAWNAQVAANASKKS